MAKDLDGTRKYCVELIFKMLEAKPNIIGPCGSGEKAAEQVTKAAGKLEEYLYPDKT